MSGEYTIETRRRSRSKTPFLRSSCDHENCEHAGEEGHLHHHHQKKKVPNVQTIAEEVIEVTSSSSSPIKAGQLKAVKTKTSDYSSEDNSPENSIKVKSLLHSSGQQQSSSETTTTTTKKMSSNTNSSTTSSTTVVTTKRVDHLLNSSSGGVGAAAATSTPKFSKMSQSFAAQFADAGTGIEERRRRKEITQNTLNAHKEASDISLGRSGAGGGLGERRRDSGRNASHNRSGGRDSTTSFSRISGGGASFTGDLSDHLAYLEYKRAGEYWNVTPKTDYTYSEFSPHRRVLAPGIVAMPNMSRQSLENYNDRAHFMAQHEQQVLRRQWGTNNAAAAATERLLYDSGDELDYQSYRKRYSNNGQQVGKQDSSWWLVRIITTIVTSVTTAFGGGSGGSDGGGIGGAGITAAGLEASSAIRARKSSSFNSKYGSVERKGLIGAVGRDFSSAYGAVARYAGILITSILCLDTWLLSSSRGGGVGVSRTTTTSTVAGRRGAVERTGRKRFLLLLLFLLLPLLLLAAWYLTPAEDRLIYVQQAQGYVPVKLVSNWRTSLQSTGAALKGLWYWPASLTWSSWWLWLWGGAATQSSTTKSSELHMQQLQSALTPAEYEQLLLHVNGYVQQLVDVKMQQQHAEHLKIAQSISPEQMKVIVNVMHENLDRVVREKRDALNAEAIRDKKDFKLSAALSEVEIHRLADLVQQQLRASGQWKSEQQPVQLSTANLAEIKRLITEHIEVNNHAHYTLLVERIDLDALLARLLSAPQLAAFVDRRIGVALDGRLLKLQATQQREELQRRQQQKQEESTSATFAATERVQEEHQRVIVDLSSEIGFIKLALSDKQSENEDLQKSIMRLKVSQDDLLQRLQQHELATDKRFTALLAEIEAKLATLNGEEQFTQMNQQIKLSLLEILGFKQKAAADGQVQLEDADLQAWVRNMFVAKDYLEQRLLELNNRTHNRIRDEIDRSGVILMRDVSERLKSDVLLAVRDNQAENVAMLKGHIRAALSEEEVQKIVKSVLAIYDADKTGLVDFALESAGGQILSTRCTESYQTKTAQLSVFGIPLWYPTNTPRVAISPNVQPGECWAFQGFPGFLVLKLNSMVYVTGFTLEHIPKSLSPNGHIDSAPRNFTVWGLEHEKDHEPILFGEYEYADNDAALQYFPLQNKDIRRPYDIVELRIESNHGQPQYTCLYRFRVHGKPPAA